MKNNKYRNRIVSILLMIVMVFTTQSLVFAEAVPESNETVLLAADQSTDTATTSEITVPYDIKYELSGLCSNMTATISWSGVTDKNAMYAVQVKKTDGGWSDDMVANATDITECTYKVKGLSNTSTYTVRVGAYTDVRRIKWNDAEELTIEPFIVPQATITSISVPKENDNIITIKWDLSDIDHCKKVRLVRNSTLSTTIDKPATSYTFHAVGGVKTYYIRAYSTDHNKVYSVSEGMKSSDVPSYLTYVRKKFVWKATFKKKATVYTTSTGTKKKTTCKKGTIAEAIGKYPSKLGDWEDPERVKIELEDGRTGWVAYSAVKIKADLNIKKDYAKSTKLEFVNDFDSDTKYLVWVNQYTMRVNIFKGKKGDWKLIRTKRVVVGEFKKPLGYGSGYSLGSKVGRVYRVYEDGRVYYFDLARGFHGSGYFHTRSKWETGGYRNSIGSKPNTRGCIRMYDEDAQYVWDMPANTRVVIR